MKYLLDTQVWLWLQADPDRISDQVLRRLSRQDSEPILSAASCWEIAIKFSIGKLPLPEGPEIYVPKRIATSGVQSLALEAAHTLSVAALPMHHRDPFDRVLIAQAQVEGLTVVTADRKFEPYDVRLIWTDER